jgi:hypothetical protein
VPSHGLDELVHQTLEILSVAVRSAFATAQRVEISDNEQLAREHVDRVAESLEVPRVGGLLPARSETRSASRMTNAIRSWP